MFSEQMYQDAVRKIAQQAEEIGRLNAELKSPRRHVLLRLVRMMRWDESRRSYVLHEDELAELLEYGEGKLTTEGTENTERKNHAE